MEIIVFESEAYKHLQEEQEERHRVALQQAYEKALAKSDPFKMWVSKEKAMEMLDIKEGKLKKLKKTKKILASTHERVILYQVASILDYIKRGVSN